uniref:Uncharacterized protein n=1 Tax=Chenopodium quinoa TaxID=63459 RepID=A0A803LPU0_CHEQI
MGVGNPNKGKKYMPQDTVTIQTNCSARQPIKGIGGSVYVLMIIYLDHLNRPPLRWNFFPRIGAWTDEQVRDAKNADKCSKGDFGNIESLAKPAKRKRTYPCPNDFLHQARQRKKEARNLSFIDCGEQYAWLIHCGVVLQNGEVSTNCSTMDKGFKMIDKNCNINTSEWGRISLDMPRQKDGVSCGVHMLAAIKLNAYQFVGCISVGNIEEAQKMLFAEDVLSEFNNARQSVLQMLNLN